VTNELLDAPIYAARISDLDVDDDPMVMRDGAYVRCNLAGHLPMN
jgi:hypothetical protein